MLVKVDEFRPLIFGFAAPNMLLASILVKTEHFLMVWWGVGVVIGRRDHHFRFPHTEFNLGTDFR